MFLFCSLHRLYSDNIIWVHNRCGRCLLLFVNNFEGFDPYVANRSMAPRNKAHTKERIWFNNIFSLFDSHNANGILHGNTLFNRKTITKRSLMYYLFIYHVFGSTNLNVCIDMERQLIMKNWFRVRIYIIFDYSPHVLKCVFFLSFVSSFCYSFFDKGSTAQPVNASCLSKYGLW